MKTDRELLEMAAKAAGINVVPYTWCKGTGWDHEGFTIDGAGEYEWNPLEDDGDALRLAVKLRIVVQHAPRYVVAIFLTDKHEIACHEDCGDSPESATRRAIVRAAAEIGESLP